MKNFIWLLAGILILIPGLVSGHNKDSLHLAPDPIHRNVIKFNPTPMMLWSKKNVTFSYERILNNKQSMTFTLGYLEFGPIAGDTIARLVTITDRQKQGVNFSFEYRFYLMSRNSRPIPDGVFLAPYFSFYGYTFSNGMDIVGSTANDFARMDGKFYCFNTGAALGYQFLFWKRITLDLVLIGPAISYYGGEINIKGELNGENVKEINEDLYNKIKEKYPMIDDIILDKSFKKDGTIDLFSVGFRYLIQFGFHF
jgi:hypothetical protein